MDFVDGPGEGLLVDFDSLPLINLLNYPLQCHHIPLFPTPFPYIFQRLLPIILINNPPKVHNLIHLLRLVLLPRLPQFSRPFQIFNRQYFLLRIPHQLIVTILVRLVDSLDD